LCILRRMTNQRWAVAVVVGWLGMSVGGVAQTPSSPLVLVKAMVAHEDDNSAHRDRYEFLSVERSERTGGHVWTERVVEIADGRVRRLIAEDGQPLRADRVAQEKARLQGIVADPAAFLAKEKAQKDDEAKARQMLDMLPRAYTFDNVRLEGGVWKMDFHPDPAYSPSGIEERVLHGMSGWVAMDEKQQRLLHIEGSLPADVSIGFGLLATIKAGSHFLSERKDIDGHWRTVHVVTDVRGKAALFKSVAKNSEVTRSEFVYVDPNITLAQAVELVLR
jgi:hypothetical protein